MQATAIDFALVVFDHTEAAERAYSEVPNAAVGAEWAQEVAFVEHHRHDRLVVRGTFAGHYLDADDDQEFIGADTARGALGGAAVGLLFGPAGLAAGMVGGAVAGSLHTEHSGARLRSALFDELRSEVPEGSSAVMLFAPAAEVDAMIDGLDGHGGRIVRHRLGGDAARILQDAVAESPSASPRPA